MPSDQLNPLPATLDAFRQGALPLNALVQQWRAAAEGHEPALPQRYRDVLERILTQLESSALFSEESCSFSQTDIVNALNDWWVKARALG
ncbi:hypothetical protein [Aquabacterium sp. CECT 9606]|uniref:hypothetical protein n=1 Tax=Aquabacterium sp. CECT 9606 TaxID=2845822 RepID=UPI001E3E5B80|nr:hypothetical protein [Aquabacterium sp. CECT 9606]CAH0354387.1 hypothetical protein AQB9606_03691 [Aquabacterium sp. CECT 9606]